MGGTTPTAGQSGPGVLQPWEMPITHHPCRTAYEKGARAISYFWNPRLSWILTPDCLWNGNPCYFIVRYLHLPLHHPMSPSVCESSARRILESTARKYVRPSLHVATRGPVMGAKTPAGTLPTPTYHPCRCRGSASVARHSFRSAR